MSGGGKPTAGILKNKYSLPADILLMRHFCGSCLSRRFGQGHQPLQQHMRMQAITSIQMQLLLSKRLQRQFINILPSPQSGY